MYCKLFVISTDICKIENKIFQSADILEILRVDLFCTYERAWTVHTKFQLYTSLHLVVIN